MADTRENAMTGKWRVTTETSVHLIDYDNMMVTRLPGEGGPAVPHLPPPTVSDLRKDAEALPLLEVPEPVVGERLPLYVQIRDDGVPTIRLTTYVQAVEKVVESAHIPG
jgi:hypothetical protein